MGQALAARLHTFVKGCAFEGEPSGIKTDIISRYQPSVPVKGRVFHCLRRDGGRKLMKTAQSVHDSWITRDGREELSQRGQYRLQIAAVFPGLPHRAQKRRSWARATLLARRVASVAAQVSNCLGERLTHGVIGEEITKGSRYRPELGCELRSQQFLSRLSFLLVEGAIATSVFLPEVLECAPLILVKDGRQLIHRVISCCTIDAPVRERLAICKDFLDHDVSTGSKLIERLPQSQAIVSRIRDPIDMIDANAVNEALAV